MSEQLTPEVVAEIQRITEGHGWVLPNYALVLANLPALLAAVRERDTMRGLGDVWAQVARAEKRIAELEAALKLARSHVISHHAAHLNGGDLGWCPVCHKEDGTEPEMDLIDSALNGGAK